MILLVSIPNETLSIRNFRLNIISPIQIRRVTRSIPPGPFIQHSAISRIYIIIIIIGSKASVVVSRQWVTSISAVARNRQSVFIGCVCYCKTVVVRISPFAVKRLHVYVQFGWFRCHESVEFDQTKPDISWQITKSFFILLPVPRMLCKITMIIWNNTNYQYNRHILTLHK